MTVRVTWVEFDTQGGTTLEVIADVAAAQTNQGLNATIKVAVVANSSTTQSDQLGSSGAVDVTTIGNWTQDADQVTASVNVSISASSSTSQEDQLGSTGDILVTTTGTWIQDSDSLVGASKVAVVADGTWIG